MEQTNPKAQCASLLSDITVSRSNSADHFQIGLPLPGRLLL